MFLWRLYELLFVNSQAQFLIHNRQTVHYVSASLPSSVLPIPTMHNSGFYLYVKPTPKAHIPLFSLSHVHGWVLLLISPISVDWKAQVSLSTSSPTLDSQMCGDGGRGGLVSNPISSYFTCDLTNISSSV